jgi:hypothetical protein
MEQCLPIIVAFRMSGTEANYDTAGGNSFDNHKVNHYSATAHAGRSSMKKSYIGNALIVLLALSGIGCKGLTVQLSAVPDPADPGDSVKWTVSVRNDTQCPTVEEVTDLPAPLPDTAGAIAFIFGFVPELDQFGPAEFCRVVMSCDDPSCILTRVEEAMGPAVAANLRAQANAATAAPGIAPGTCEDFASSSDGVFALCAFDALDPGETATAMYTANAPDSGSRNAAQVAIAFAPAVGDDCRPGTQVGDDEWILGGCFPLATSTSAPALSPTATGIAAGILLIAGMTGIYRRRRS